MGFRYQAIDAGGQTLTDVLDVASVEEATAVLRERGLFVTQIAPDDGLRDQPAKSTATGTSKVKFREIVVFAQQMAMLLKSGAPVLEALEIVANQAVRPTWQSVLTRVYTDVQEGRPLSAALTRFPRIFSDIFVSMVTAGEASGELAVAFDRLAELTLQQQAIRNRVIGAISYPATLLVLCGGVLLVLLTFILPRFAEMFEALDLTLPVTTSLMISGSLWAQAHWAWVLGGVLTCIVGTVFFVRSSYGRQLLSWMALRVPLFGSLARNVILARICMIWGQLLQSKVGLLDAVHIVQCSTSNSEFRQLLGSVAESVSEGSRAGNTLRSSWLLPQIFAGAITTGEESGRLADALLFVGHALQDQNTEAMGSLTRTVEPIILAVMGLVVGVIAFSLFLPMFDMATVGG